MEYPSLGTPPSCIMKLFVGLLVLLICNLAIAANFSIIRKGNVVVFQGKLTKESVAATLAELERDPTEELMIHSWGGDSVAAMRLGRAVRARSLSVVVQVQCFSACANYVFPAGKSKRITDGALVAWHGGALQKNFREMVDKYRLIKGIVPSERTSEQVAWLEANADNSELVISVQQEQVQFFDEIGVDERITRLGQEPVDLGPSWTVTSDTMKAFGIHDVALPSGYNTSEYVRRSSQGIWWSERVVLLRADPKSGEISVVGDH